MTGAMNGWPPEGLYFRSIRALFLQKLFMGQEIFLLFFLLNHFRKSDAENPLFTMSVSKDI